MYDISYVLYIIFIYVILYRCLLHDLSYEFCEICIFNPPTQIAVAVTNTRATNYSLWCLYTGTQVNKFTFTHNHAALSLSLFGNHAGQTMTKLCN